MYSSQFIYLVYLLAIHSWFSLQQSKNLTDCSTSTSSVGKQSLLQPQVN